MPTIGAMHKIDEIRNKVIPITLTIHAQTYYRYPATDIQADMNVADSVYFNAIENSWH